MAALEGEQSCEVLQQVCTALDAASVGFFTGNNRGWHLDAHQIKVVHFRFSSALNLHNRKPNGNQRTVDDPFTPMLLMD